MRRRQFIQVCGVLGAATAGISSASAEAPRLSQALRGQIEQLPPVQNSVGLSRGALTNRPTLVTFFASWCPPCRTEFTYLQQLYAHYHERGVEFVALNLFEAWDDNDVPRMQKFLAQTQPTFPVLTANDTISEAFGGIDRIPTVYGFASKGALVYEFIHRRGASKTNASLDELTRAAEKLLLESE